MGHFDKALFKASLEQLGAIYVKTPIIHVVRKQIKRDDRHTAELPLEQSLHMFAEETEVSDVHAKVTFAIELAVEADAGITE